MSSDKREFLQQKKEKIALGGGVSRIEAQHAKGKKTKVVVHQPEPIDVRAIREKTGMSQQKFCATFGISLGTLRHWEQGLRSPRGPARVLLKVVDNDPKAVMRVVGT